MHLHVLPTSNQTPLFMDLKARQIADYLQGTIEGDPEATVNQIAKIEEAVSGTITFLANPVYTQYVYSTKASIVLVSNSFKPEKPLGCTIIRVEDPYGALSKLLELYRKSIPEKKGVSSLAFIGEGTAAGEDNYIGEFVVIGQGVKLGKNIKIHPHCYIGDFSVIGDHTTIYSGVRIYDHTLIGRSCTIHSNAVLGADGFGFTPHGSNGFMKVQQIGNVVIEDDVEIGAGTTIDRATMGSTVIGKGVKLDNLIQIAHNVVIGENTIMAAQSGVAGSTRIGSNCMIGGQVGIIGHLNIGDDVKIAAQSGISTNIKSGEIHMGSPSFPIASYRKSYVHFRNLDKIVKKIKELEEQIDKLNSKRSD